MKSIKTPMQSGTPQKVQNTKRHVLLRSRRKWNVAKWSITGPLVLAFFGCSFIPLWVNETSDMHLTHKEVIYQDSHVYLAGVVHDATKISPIVLKVLVELNCIDGIGIHIFTSEPHPPGVIEKHRSKYDNCAPFLILRESPDLIARFPKRVHRIALIRDLQRQMLQNLFRGRALENDVVIVADFDLYQFPSRSSVAREIDRLIREKDHDVICSAGEMSDPLFGYYDIFATVLLPNTFVYPLAGRYRKEYSQGENRSLVRSDDVFGSFTQRDLMEYFEEEAKKAAGTVPVRSCFGGFALYRASKFFTPECGYNNLTGNSMRFANRDDAVPCEHVIFHECLRSYDPSIRIAVKPSLKPMWKPPEPYYSNLKSGGIIASGLKHSDGLVTFARSPENGSRLVNGEYCLRINDKGFLVVENWPTNKSSKIIWRAETNPSVFRHDWTTMFLILDNNGLLKLVQQVEASSIELNSTSCEPVEPNGTMCRVVVWTSDVEGEPWPSPGRYVLVLRNDGSLQIYDAFEKHVVWTNNLAKQQNYQLLDDEANTPRAYDFESYWEIIGSKDDCESTLTCNKAKLDFLIAGFPKCGTTTLLAAFRNHDETSIGIKERCGFEDEDLSDADALSKLNEAINELESMPLFKRGIKCPTAIKFAQTTVDRLKSHSPKTRIIIGVRHPVLFLQSYYNYRITEIYDNNLPKDIRPLESLMGTDDEWLGVSTESSRFELFLMQLGKTNNGNNPIKPNRFQIFLYSIEQLNDADEKRAASFRNDLQQFLQLKQPIEPFGHENINHFKGALAHNESIDICMNKYKDIREKLMEQGKRTQQWILNEFLTSPDVFAGGQNHFVELLQSWDLDPCNDVDITK